jgi:hypothetical protein
MAALLDLDVQVIPGDVQLRDQVFHQSLEHRGGSQQHARGNEFGGLRARGGFQVDITWTNGVLVSAAIQGAGGSRCAVRYGAGMRQERVPRNGSLRFVPER